MSYTTVEPHLKYGHANVSLGGWSQQQQHPKAKGKTKLHQKLSWADQEFETEGDTANYPITTPCELENNCNMKSVRSYLRPHMVSFTCSKTCS